MGQKNSKSENSKETNNSSSSKQELKVWYSNADVLTTDKVNGLEGQIDGDYPDIVSPQKIIRTFSLVEKYING